MKKKPLISIIITYYKKRKFIKKTINSILSQTYKNYELILVYDDDDKSEIKFLKKNFSYGLFNCDRNIKSFEKTIKKIIENYRYIQSNILKIKIHTQKNFQTQMYYIIKKK